MALASYLSRREGRYYLQVRLAPQLASIVGRQLYRASLRTADYRQARMRLTECMGWVHRMNESTDFVTLLQKNVVELQRYLQDAWPVTDERLFARKNYEELLKNLTRKAQAAGCDPEMVEPDYFDLFKRFVVQNVDAENWLRKAENVRHYERGRADMEAALQVGAAPASFRQVHSGATAQTSVYPPARPHDSAPDPFMNTAMHLHQSTLEARRTHHDQDRPKEPLTNPTTAARDTTTVSIFDDVIDGGTRQVELPPLSFSEALAIYVEEDIAK